MPDLDSPGPFVTRLTRESSVILNKTGPFVEHFAGFCHPLASEREFPVQDPAELTIDNTRVILASGVRAVGKPEDQG